MFLSFNLGKEVLLFLLCFPSDCNYSGNNSEFRKLKNLKDYFHPTLTGFLRILKTIKKSQI